MTLLGADETAAAMWARYLEAAGTKNTTAARKLTAVSSFYGWCARRGHLTASPFVSLDRPVVDYDTSATPGLSGDQATALLEAADTDRGPQAARTAALKVGRRWTAEEESVARSAFAGAFGKAPAFGVASMSPPRSPGSGERSRMPPSKRPLTIETSSAGWTLPLATIPQERSRSKSSSSGLFMHTLIRLAPASTQTSPGMPRLLKFPRLRKLVLLVIWWIIILTAGFSILVGGVVSLAILGGCIFVYFTFNPYDHR